MERTMEKIKKHQEIIVKMLKSLATDYSNEENSELEDEVICDFVGNHFQLLTVGWQNKRHIFIVNCHLDIKPDGKIWIMANNTDILIADELKNQGVLASDIVLGLKPANVRKHTGFATA